MSPEAFATWLATMKVLGYARTDRSCGKLIGVKPNTILHYKAHGTNRRTALACRALAHGLPPWGEELKGMSKFS